MAETPTTPAAPQVTPDDSAVDEAPETAADQAQIPEAAGPAHDEPAGQDVYGDPAEVVPLSEQDATPVMDRPGSPNRLSPSDVREALAEHTDSE